MEVHQQNALFQYFSDTLAAVIQEAKRNGRYDMGILGEAGFLRSLHGESAPDGNDLLLVLDLGSGDEKVKKMDCRKFLTPGYTTSGHVELHTVCLRIGFGYYVDMFLVIMRQQ